MDQQVYVYLRFHISGTSAPLTRRIRAPAYLPSNSLSNAEPGCSSESLPVLTSSEKAGPTPAPGCVTGGTAEGSSGLGSAQILAITKFVDGRAPQSGPEVQAEVEKRKGSNLM